MYYNGKGVTQNNIEAAKWFRKAAEQGHASAFGSLGWILITQGKFDEAQSVTEKAHQKQPQAFAWAINLGHTYLLKGDSKTARRYYQKALPLIPDEASQGPIADLKLFIEKGWQVKACQSELNWIKAAFANKSVSPSPQAAFKAVAEKAKQGDAEAQNKLGLMYANGVTQNDVEAVKWYRKAADQGHADAQFNLGVMYANGKGVTQNYQNYIVAAKWFRKAADQGHADAQFNLGVMYADGERVTQNDVEATKWYRKAADQGHAKAQFNLGVMYANGKGVTQNDDEATKWYRKAAEQGQADAQFNLGVMYANGKGVTQNDIEAAKWYRKAADQGLAKAQFNLGVMYDNGKGVTQNDVEATKWYHKAAEQGYAKALFDLSKRILPMTKGIYEFSKMTLGEEHPDTLDSLESLATIYLGLYRFSEALPLFKESYRLRKKVLGERHPDTLRSMDNLALIYKKLGRYKEALPLYEECYRLRKKLLGEKDSDTLTSMENLASIYQDLGRLSKALSLSKECYRLRKELLGEKQPDTIKSLNSLAIIYKELGRLSEALPLLEKNYRLSKEVFGEKHPYTLTSMNNLASIYQDLGRLSEALPLFEKGYRLRKELLGEKHPDILSSLNSLAGIYKDLGRLSEALLLFEKNYRLSSEVLGEKHPNTLKSLNNLAIIYQDLGRFSEALPLYEKGYRLSKEVLGEKHPSTLNSLANLTTNYQYLGRFSEALPLSEESYRLRSNVLGEKHPDTITSLNNLATNYQNSGRLSEALPLFEKGYRLFKEVLGEKHPKTLASMNNFASLYKDLGRLSEALPLLEKSYRLRKEVLGEKHPDTIASLNNLAVIYQEPSSVGTGLGRLSEALPLLEKGYRLFKEVLGEKHPDTILSLHNLASAYAKQGSINKAIEHYEKFVQGVETLRSGDLSAENRQALFEKWVVGYFKLSDLYIAQSRSEDAFRLAEMSKARTLLESLAAKLAAQQSGLTATEQQQLQDYEARLAFLNNRIAKTLADNRLEEKMVLENEKNQLVIQLAQFEGELKAKYPKYDQLSKAQIISAKEGAKSLPADAVLISYLVHKNKVLAFTLQANGSLTAHDLGEIPSLEKDLKTYRIGLAPVQDSKRDQNPAHRPNLPEKVRETQFLSQKFGKQLLEPLKDIIKDKPHWIISPSGPLASIPFETLRFSGEKQPVIAQHQISYVQSLSVLAMLQKRDKAYKGIKNRSSLFAMGAPIYQQTGISDSDSTKRRIPNQTDFKIAESLVRGSGDYTRAFGQLDLKWKELPGTLEELKQLETLFKGEKPRIYKQKDATEAKLQSLNKQGVLAKYRYLVFSAHGHLDRQVPALSSLVLGQVDNPEGTDGYVTAGEWPGYNLKSDLIVLSACETGVGEAVGGEGVMGLPYALFVAGNKNTLLTLWSISDEVTAQFMVSFFQKLKAGTGQIEALTATKREFLKKGGRYANPMYWAAFVLYGV
jgi:TPR repeat protein/CHAT domain-containing protein